MFWVLLVIWLLISNFCHLCRLLKQIHTLWIFPVEWIKDRVHTSSAMHFLQGADSLLSRSIKTLESILMVHQVQGNLRIPPMCTEFNSGVNEGKCTSPLPSQSRFNCGEFGTIPLSYIGVREVCTLSFLNSTCTLQGPNGAGLPNADYLLFVSASSTSMFLLN